MTSDGSEASHGLAISVNSSISSMASFASFGPDRRTLGAGRSGKAALGAKGTSFKPSFYDPMAPQLTEDKWEDTEDEEGEEGKSKSVRVAEVVGRRTGLLMRGPLAGRQTVLPSAVVALKPTGSGKVIADGGAACSPPSSAASIAPPATALFLDRTRATAQRAERNPQLGGMIASSRIQRNNQPSSGTRGRIVRASAPAPTPGPAPSLAPPTAWRAGAERAAVKVTAPAWAASDYDRHSGVSTFGPDAEEIRLSAPGVASATAPERAIGRAAVDEPPMIQDEGASKGEASARGGKEETRNAVVADGGSPHNELRAPRHSYLAVLRGVLFVPVFSRAVGSRLGGRELGSAAGVLFLDVQRNCRDQVRWPSWTRGAVLVFPCEYCLCHALIFASHVHTWSFC